MLYSQQHNCCVYTPADPQPVVAAIPHARVLQNGMIAVPCSMHEMQLMRHLGFEALSPMLKEYDWPLAPDFRTGKPRSLFNHQPLLSAFLTLHRRCFNLSDIGTTKTITALWAWDYLMQKGFVKKVVILAPLSTIRRVWEDEIATNFLSRRKSIVVYGDRKKRERLIAEDADFYIINHDGLGVGCQRSNRGIALGEIASRIRDDPDFNAFGVDEGSVYKDSGTLRYKILRQVTFNKPYLWWLTATPTPNEPTDAWAQARVVRLDYQESQKNFKERTMYRVSTFKWLPKKGSEKSASEILQPAIRVTRDECYDLPPLMMVTRDVELTPAQKKAIDDIKKNLRLHMQEGKPVTAVNEAALRLKLIQIACGAVYGDQHEAHKIDCQPRINVLREIIEQTNEKLLIFAPLTSVLNLLYSDLSKDYSVELINGQVSSNKRSEIFAAFQREANPRIIVADPRTMAHGLTLTAASTIVWYGPTDQPEVYTQANGRINRPGQTKSMLIVRLAATNTEREIFKRLDNKESMQGLVLKLVEGDE